MAKADAVRQGDAGVALGLVGHQRHFLHAFRGEFAKDLDWRHAALDRLTAGHRDEAVEKNLVGDRHVGRDRLADRERAGMGVGAVADIGEHVILAGERLLPEPHRSFAAHVRCGCGLLRIDQRRHPVASDSRERAAPLGDWRRSIVRASGAKSRTAHRRRAIAERRARRFRRAQAAVRIVAGKRLDQHSGDELGRNLAVIGNGWRALRRIERAAVEILADDARRAMRAVEDRAHLIFDQRPLLLDDDDEVEALGEVAHDDGIERPYHADLEQAQAERSAIVGEAEVAERLQQILPGFARRDHADPCAGAVADDAVEAIGARIGERRRQLVIVEPLLLRDRRVDRSRAEAPRRVAWPFGNDDLWRVRSDIDRAAAFGDVGDDFHADPAAGKARHGDAVQPVIEQFLRVRGIDHRHADGDERRVGEIDRGRRFRAVVVAGERDRAALGRSAGKICVTQGVARAVDARPLAVPDAEHAIDGRAGKAVEILGAPDRGRGEVLVESGAEDDVVALEQRRRAPELDVVAPERRAAIAGNISAGVEALGGVAQALLDRQADKRLHAGHVEPALGRVIAGVESRLRPGEGDIHESVPPRLK